MPGQTHTHTTNKHTHEIELQTVATVSLSKKDIAKNGVREGGGDMRSTAGDLCWEKQISLKPAGEVDLSHSLSPRLLPPLKPTYPLVLVTPLHIHIVRNQIRVSLR